LSEVHFHSRGAGRDDKEELADSDSHGKSAVKRVTNRWVEVKTYRKTDPQTERQADGKTERWTEQKVVILQAE